MVVLVTGQGSALAAAISAELTASGFTVRLARLGAGQDERGCSSEELVAGASQIILVEPAVLASILPASAWLDVCTRCVYDILIAAADHAVPRVLVLSSMDVFLAHAPDVGVMPVFQPLPSCELSVLAPHMAEFACREFAMCGAVEVLAARLGTLVTDPPRPGDVLPPRWWVQLKEAAAAVGDAVRGFAGPTPLSRRHAHAFDTINLAHGDDETADGSFPNLVPKAANSGNPHWKPPAIATVAARATAAERPDKILILGGGGLMGPDVVANLAATTAAASCSSGQAFTLRITDVADRPARRDLAQVKRSAGQGRGSAIDAQTPETDPRHEYLSVDITDLAEVHAAAEGTDAIVICSVSREHPVLAFSVNCHGVYNAMLAAVEAGHRRLINTGPWSVVGGHYRNWYHGLHENMPPQSGLDLYSFSKGLGHEIARCFSASHPIHVMTSMHGSFPSAEWHHSAQSPAVGTNPGVGVREGDGLSQPLCSTYSEAAAVIRAMLEVDLAGLPSRHETFFVLPTVPDGVYSNAKARKILGWEPRHTLTSYFTRQSLSSKL